MAKPIAYDVGANVGANFEYYLAKGFRVIAVDADPALTDGLRERFAGPIASGDLEVLNVGVGPEPDELPFYRHEYSEHNSFQPPAPDDDVDVIRVEVRRLSEIIADHGDPAFVKLDVEGLDAAVLHELQTAGIRPPQLAVEAHEAAVPEALVAMGYRSFQLINGGQVGVRGLTHRIVDGRRIDFPPGSAGPMGDDLHGPWVGPKGLLRQWRLRNYLYGWGWFDVHARLEPPETSVRRFATQWRDSFRLRR